MVPFAWVRHEWLELDPTHQSPSFDTAFCLKIQSFREIGL
jgi:hypothetical protein